MAAPNEAVMRTWLGSFASRHVAAVEGYHCGEYANASLRLAMPRTTCAQYTRLLPLNTATSQVARAVQAGSGAVVNGSTKTKE